MNARDPLLSEVTPDALAFCAALLAARSPLLRDPRSVVDEAVAIVAEVQRRVDEQAEIELELAIFRRQADDGQREADEAARSFNADCARALAVVHIASSRRLAILPLNDAWVVKPDGVNDERVELNNASPQLAVLTWAKLHAPEDLVQHGIDPRSETFDLLSAADLAQIAAAQNARGA